MATKKKAKIVYGKKNDKNYKGSKKKGYPKRKKVDYRIKH